MHSNAILAILTVMLNRNIIFLPGFMCDERLFAKQIGTFKNIGLTPVTANSSKHDNISLMAKSILAETGGKFALVGLSMGGIIALEIYKQAPERVTHLALLNSTPFADRSQTQRHEHIARAQQGEILSIISEDLKPKYLAPANHNPEILRLVIKMAEKLGAEVFVRQSLALLYRGHYLDVLSQIKCPTLILTGKQDGVCGTDIAEYMADRIRRAKYVALDNCGHLSTLEQADQVTHELADLLDVKFKNQIGVNA